DSRSSVVAMLSTASQGCRKPAVWLPCPGQRTASTCPPCLLGSAAPSSQADEIAGAVFGGFLQRLLVVQPAQREGGLYGVPASRAVQVVPAGLACAGEAVAHGVGVNEQRASRCLDRRTGAEE